MAIKRYRKPARARTPVKRWGSTPEEREERTERVYKQTRQAASNRANYADDRREAVQAYKQRIIPPAITEARRIGEQGTDERTQATAGAYQAMVDRANYYNSQLPNSGFTWRGRGGMLPSPARMTVPSRGYNPSAEQRYYGNLYQLAQSRWTNPFLLPQYYGYSPNLQIPRTTKSSGNQVLASSIPLWQRMGVPTIKFPPEHTVVLGNLNGVLPPPTQPNTGTSGGGWGGYDYPYYYGGGGGGGGGYSYSNPFKEYRPGYALRGSQAQVTPSIRTAGTGQPTYYNNNSAYPARWQQLLTSWRI